MRKIFFAATLMLGALTAQVQETQAQEKVLNIQKTDGTTDKTRAAEIEEISVLTSGKNSPEQTATMIVKTTNGAATRTAVSDVEEISFADTTYTLNSSGYRILEANELTWPEDRLLPCLLPPASPVRTLDMPAANLSDEERVMFCALQGLVNRTQPRILLLNHKEEDTKIWPTAHGLRTTSTVVSKAYGLVSRYQDEINGLVLYSNELSEHYGNLAVTIAGLERLLPVTAEIRQKLIDNGMDFPVVEDLTSLTMTTATDIYTYLYDNYWSRCNHRLLISERPTIPYVHDIGVAAGSACVYLDPRTASEKAVLDKMLQDMTPGRDIVLGWYAEERSGIGEATRYGLSTVPADFFENATVYTAVNTPVKINPVPKRGKLENKIYAAVYISDGDNIQYCQHAMAKIYAQTNRGKLPLNWTVSPSLGDISPSMLNYYYKKATDNDCFVSGPSGLGYAMPYDALNSCYYATARDGDLITPYVQLSNRYVEKAGLRVITVWDNLSTPQRKVYAENCPYLYGVSVNDWEKTSRITAKIQGNIAFVPQYPCYAGGADVITDFFNRDIKNFKGTEPMFVTGQASVWNAGPNELVALNSQLEALSPGNVNIVRADQWFSYYNEANHLPFNITMLEDMEITSSATSTKAEYAADGSPSEEYTWTSETADGTGWVQMDFKDSFEISRYVVRHAEASGLSPQLNSRDFTVEVSQDGTTWTTVGTHKGNTSPVTDVTITPVEARYVRVNVTDGGDDGYVRIGDIEVYGKK